jgi:hypothetical protein
MTYDSEDEAVAIANGTTYGLAGYVQGRDIERVRRVAERIRAGRIYLNGAPVDRSVPFGGLQAIGQWPRARRVRLRGVSRGEGGAGLSNGLNTTGEATTSSAGLYR